MSNLSGAPSSTGFVSIHKHSPLAELINTPRITQGKWTMIGSARVLISTESIRALEDKEEQKRLVQEEKQKRKKERGLKKDRGRGKGMKSCKKGNETA